MIIDNETKIKLFQHMLQLEHLGEDKTFDFADYVERSNGFFEALTELGLGREYINWAIGK